MLLDVMAFIGSDMESLNLHAGYSPNHQEAIVAIGDLRSAAISRRKPHFRDFHHG